MTVFLKTVFYNPILNTLAILVVIMPGHNMGFAIIALTLIIRIILFPVSKRSVSSQIKMNALKPEIDEIKEKYKDNKEKRAKKTFELYKKNKINPFSGCLFAIIQLAIILPLYYVLRNGIDFGVGESLYSFVTAPTDINFNFLGFINLQEKSLLLAILAAVSQFLQMKFSSVGDMFKQNKKEQKEPKNTKEALAQSFQKSMSQMKYAMPVLIGIIAYQLASAIALYWVVSNIFTIGQEIYIKRNLKMVHTDTENGKKEEKTKNKEN